VLTVGDIDVTRDFCDVRDVVGAYARLLASAGSGDTFNICSGTEYPLRSLIERLAEIAGVDVKIEQDPDRFRPSEQRRMVGSCEALRLATGWEPAIEIDDSLRDIMNHELEALST
jgi:GDP-4-dehydro-6-deoxy-D-mannose reductase